MRTLLAVLLIFSGVAMASPTIYQEENFSIEFPAGWQKGEAPPEALAVVRSADGAKGVTLMAFKIPAEESSAAALKKMVAGAKGGASKKGIPITREEDLEIHGTPFHFHSFTLPNGVAIASYMAVVGNRGYSVQGFSGTSDPSADPEIQGTIHSFQLLSPVAETAAPAKAAEPPEGAAFKAGEIAGTVAVVAFAIGVVVVMIQKRRGKKGAS